MNNSKLCRLEEENETLRGRLRNMVQAPLSDAEKEQLINPCFFEFVCHSAGCRRRVCGVSIPAIVERFHSDRGASGRQLSTGTKKGSEKIY